MSQGLTRSLKVRDQVMIGIVGAVGTGVLFSSAGMAAAAGPGVIFGWLIGGLVYGLLMLTFIELAQSYPEAGGPTRYSLYSHGRITNLINSMSDLLWYLLVSPIEALATVEGINYFWPHMINASGTPTLVGGLVSAALLLIFMPFNYFGVRIFANSVLGLGTAKLVLYLAAAVGFLAVARFGNLVHYGGVAPFGINGIFLAVPLGMFAYGGVRVVADYSEELEDPSTIRRTLIWILLGQTALYVLFSVAFLASLNWSKVHIHPGDWAAVATITGNPFLTVAKDSSLGWLIPLTIVIAVFGPFMTGYIYQGAGSRVLMAISRSGFVSKRLRQISDEYRIPLWSLACLAIVGAVLAFLSAPVPTIYTLIEDAVVAGYVGLATNPVVMLSLRRNGIQPRAPLPGARVIAVLAFGAASLIVYWSGWPSVPYAVAVIAVGCVVFALIYRVKQNLANAWWYIVYILFLLGMSAIGDVGLKDVVNLDLGSGIVVVVSCVIFLPWGIASRMGKAEMEVTHEEQMRSGVPAANVG